MRWQLAALATFGRARGRERTHSRPRVARAIAAARSVHVGTSGGLGSARAGRGFMLTSTPALPPAMAGWVWAPDGMEGFPAGLAPVAAWGPARQAGVMPLPAPARGEVWSAWPVGYDAVPRAPRHPTGRERARRLRVWGDIDETMGALRAG